MSVPVRRSLKTRSPHPRLGMQAKEPLHELRIGPLVNKRYKFPFFIKGVPPTWKNAPSSVKIFRPFDDLKFKLKLRMLDRQRRMLK